MTTPGPQRWWLFTIVSMIFFHLMAATFSSLGVVLPHMMEDLGLTRPGAGIGFTLLALLAGLASPLPAITLRQFGVRATYAIGGAIMASGYMLMALTTSEVQYFIAASLLGLGFPLGAGIPAIHVINSWMPERRSLAIGAFMTIGALGGVAGPLLVIGIVGATGSWRLHWWVMMASALFLALLAVIFLKSGAAKTSETPAIDVVSEETRSDNVFQTSRSWSLREALRTHQYFIIVFAMTITLLCETTIGAWAVIHLDTLGITANFAAAALSAHAAVNALSRVTGGLLATRIDPKWLLVSALAVDIVGMLALSVADNAVAITLFAICEGYGFGMCFFATTVLLVNYFGPDNNPELLGTLYFITTLATLGPVLAGYIAESAGGFGIVFQAYAVMLVVMLIATVAMKPPAPKI